VAKVIRAAYPDPTAVGEKGDRVVVDVVPDMSLKKPVTLEMIK
jgi:predicted RNA-binding protein with PUA-like domain